MKALGGQRLWGALLLGAGIAVLVAATAIRSQDGWSAVGPRFLPLIAGLALIVLSIAFLLRPGEEPAHDVELATPAAVLVALVAYVLLLEPVGYVVATTVFFPLVARVLGSRSPLRDALIGLGLGLAVFVLFTEFLGVDLPAGLTPIT